jgi:hypothetical protein
MVAVFVPALAAEAFNEMRTAGFVHSFMLPDEFEILTHTDCHFVQELEVLDRFAEFCGGKLKHYKKVMSNDYRGPVAILPSVMVMQLTRF